MKKDAKNNEKTITFRYKENCSARYKRNVAGNCLNAGKSYCVGL